jgi:hypothetical protein
MHDAGIVADQLASDGWQLDSCLYQPDRKGAIEFTGRTQAASTHRPLDAETGEAKGRDWSAI